MTPGIPLSSGPHEYEALSADTDLTSDHTVDDRSFDVIDEIGGIRMESTNLENGTSLACSCPGPSALLDCRDSDASHGQSVADSCKMGVKHST